MNIAEDDQNDDEDGYDSESDDYSESEVIGPHQDVSATGDQDAGYQRGPGMNRQEYDEESDDDDESEELIDNGAHDDIEADDEVEEVGA